MAELGLGTSSQTIPTRETQDVDSDDGVDFDDGGTQAAVVGRGLPETPEEHTRIVNTERDLPPIPGEQREEHEPQPAQTVAYQAGINEPPPWQRIHQRLLDRVAAWSTIEVDNALASTTPGQQIGIIALSIWSAQIYKRYVRAIMTDTQSKLVDRMFVPPNMAEAISSAVFEGRHNDASATLRDLWSPLGVKRAPRLLLTFSQHRNHNDHWVAHRCTIRIDTRCTSTTTQSCPFLGSPCLMGRSQLTTRTQRKLCQTAGWVSTSSGTSVVRMFLIYPHFSLLDGGLQYASPGQRLYTQIQTI